MGLEALAIGSLLVYLFSFEIFEVRELDVDSISLQVVRATELVFKQY